MNADVTIIGGGAAGIAAAVSAAESGLKVILIERYGFLGGMATAAMVGTICGLYYRGTKTPEFAVQGFSKSFAESVARRSATKPHCFSKGLYFLPYEPFAFNEEAMDLLHRAGVEIVLHAMLDGVEIKGTEIKLISAITPSGKFTIQTNAVVDCTGEALVSILARLELIEENTYQTGAFVFRVAGFPAWQPRLLEINLIRWIKKGIYAQILHPDCDRLSIVPGTLRQGLAFMKLGMPFPFTSELNARTQYEHLARSRALEIIQYLKGVDKSLMSLTIVSMAAQVGIRSGQRPVGQSVLDVDDVLECRKPVDGVAIGAWPVEYWGMEQSPEMKYFDENETYQIPAGALVSASLDNLFFAGRGLSATEYAIASARVIGTCLGTGYAAGMLAASQVSQGSWKNAIEVIRQKQVQET
ncbi:MAG: FAD-dependent oxidoreductase [Methylococcales bacterium]